MNIWIFVFSIIGVGILLIGMNFGPIYDYATYTVPLKNAKFDVNDGHHDYFPINAARGMDSMERLELLPDGDVLITFGSNKEYYNMLGGGKLPDFSYFQTFKINDTFVHLCGSTITNGTHAQGIQAVKYLGPMEIDGQTRLAFWHQSATLQQEIPCSYPEIIQSSLNLWELQAIQYKYKEDGLLEHFVNLKINELDAKKTPSPTGSYQLEKLNLVKKWSQAERDGDEDMMRELMTEITRDFPPLEEYVKVRDAMVTGTETRFTHEKTYSYENASHPPLNPLSAYSDYFVGSVREASETVGYVVSEPILPEGTTLQLIGIHGDRVVQLYASPHQISEETLDKDFTYELQGILILYERLPDGLSHLDTNTLIERWATERNIQTSLKSNDRVEAVKEISIGHGPGGGPFDIPAEVFTSISDDVQVSISGFYDGGTLKSVLAD